MRLLALGERLGRTAVAAMLFAGCGDSETPPGDGPVVDATAADTAVDSTAVQTCNADPRGRVEAELADVRDALLAYHQANGGFPASSQSPTPNVDCCTQNWGGLRCCAAVGTDWNGVATWDSFGFAQSEPFEFQFAYTGIAGGASAVMTATGNLDCDATSITYTLSCTSSGGVPSCELIVPTNED